MAEPFVGEIRAFAFGVVPRGWALCNGQVLSISNNQALYSILGITYGGDGVNNFALPNLQGRTPLHVSYQAPIQIKLGTAGGEATHNLSVSEMPAHTHQANGSNENATFPNVSENTWGTTAANRNIYAATANTEMSPSAIAPAGGNQPHNNMQPYTVLSYCIAIWGIYPSRP